MFQQKKVIISCAVTGAIHTPSMSPYLPVTPEEIAESSIAAAEAGAAIIHLHARDPVTGKPDQRPEAFTPFLKLIKQGSNAVINLTTGPGGRFVPDAEDPKQYAPGTTLLPPEKRVEHIALIRPDICSLDLNTMNSGPDVVINTPRNVRRMAAVIRAAGVMPELEIFDSGDLHLARDLIADGTLQGPGLWTFVLGVKYGFAATPETLLYARNLLPPGAVWSAFGIGRSEFPMVAQSWLFGGHVRVGMEDNIFLDKGVLAKSNAELVAKAVHIIRQMGGSVASSLDMRHMLQLAGA